MRAFGSGCALSCSVTECVRFCLRPQLMSVWAQSVAKQYLEHVSGVVNTCQYMSIHDLCLTSCYFSPIRANIVSDWTRIWGAQWCGCEHFLSCNFRAKAVAVNSHSSHSMIGYSMLQCTVTVYNCYSSDWSQQTTARYCKSRPFLGSCLVQTFCWREFMCRCAGLRGVNRCETIMQR